MGIIVTKFILREAHFIAITGQIIRNKTKQVGLTDSTKYSMGPNNPLSYQKNSKISNRKFKSVCDHKPTHHLILNYLPETKLFACKHCSFKNPKMSVLRLHGKTIHSFFTPLDEVHCKCQYCEKYNDFTRLSSYDWHVNDCHVGFPCDHCDQVYPTRSALHSHHRTNHQKQDKTSRSH